MKRIILSVTFTVVVIGGGLLFAIAHDAKTDAKPDAAADVKPEAKPDAKPEAKKEAAPEPRVTRDTNGNVVIKIEAETQKLIALKVEALPATQMAPELKGYGRVLDPAPLAALMTEMASAQAAYQASSNELARLKTLATTGNASARALQTAEAAALHDQLLAQSARDRLILSWGRAVAEQNDLPAFIQSLTTFDTALIRVDLSAADRLKSPPAAARVVTLAGDSTDAQVLGPAGGVDPQTQGQGFIFQVKTNQARLLPGEAVSGYLKAPGEPLNGVIIPRDAVVRTDGNAWVYVASSEEHFTRKEITLDHLSENGWFVTSGIAANDQVVTVGAQSLLSEEIKLASGPD